MTAKNDIVELTACHLGEDILQKWEISYDKDANDDKTGNMLQINESESDM